MRLTVFSIKLGGNIRPIAQRNQFLVDQNVQKMGNFKVETTNFSLIPDKKVQIVGLHPLGEESIFSPLNPTEVGYGPEYLNIKRFQIVIDVR